MIDDPKCKDWQTNSHLETLLVSSVYWSYLSLALAILSLKWTGHHRGEIKLSFWRDIWKLTDSISFREEILFFICFTPGNHWAIGEGNSIDSDEMLRNYTSSTAHNMWINTFELYFYSSLIFPIPLTHLTKEKKTGCKQILNWSFLLLGDILRWEQQVRLRHFLTRQYMCIDSKMDVSLVTDPSDPRTVFRLHSVLKARNKLRSLELYTVNRENINVVWILLCLLLRTWIFAMVNTFLRKTIIEDVLSH